MINFFKQQSNIKPKKFFSNAYFSKLQPIEKLSTLGFTLPNLAYDNNYYPLKKTISYVNQPNNNQNLYYSSVYNKNYLIINIVVSVRTMLTYTTLLNVNKVIK